MKNVGEANDPERWLSYSVYLGIDKVGSYLCLRYTSTRSCLALIRHKNELELEFPSPTTSPHQPTYRYFATDITSRATTGNELECEM
ncbi:unnamed protein product [Ceratitis capitata]|uniref:(Mediterranean fruit fly) hypothetical protein n=1 Tax=Ceratitis capitata TaxID=7213 RepID=A0A811VBQ7_CERCA|nr:unnamed protein product [Ceratitis capitata]